MEKIFVDFTEETKVSVIKEKARQTVINDFMDFLKERYDTVKPVGSNLIGVVVGEAKDTDGFASDVVVLIKAEVKSWYDKPAETPKGRDVVKYDLDWEAELYAKKLEQDAIKKAKKK
jgi:hypothetical protein